MVSKPEDFARWANIAVTDPVTNVANVIEPSAEKKNVGFVPFESPLRPFVNWLFKVNYDWQVYFDSRLDRDKTTDGNGSEVVDIEDCLVEVFAVDKTTPANYIVAKGYRDGSTAPSLTTTNNNTLTIDSTNADGSIVIAGATASDVLMRVTLTKPLETN